MSRKSPLEIARAYDALGINVLPARTGEKTPYVAWKAFQTERTSRYLEGWFGKLTESNYWALCGKVSGVVVVDVDNAASDEWVRELLGSSLANVCVAKTAKGRHYWFPYPEGGMRSWSKHEAGIEIDVRADGGGVILPPSEHESGKVYKWERSLLRHGVGSVDLPDALRYSDAQEGASGSGRPRRGASRGASRASRGLAGLLSEPPTKGGRNVWLAQVAGHLARKHRDSFDDYEAAVVSANVSLKPHLPGSEVTKLIDSIWQSEQDKVANKKGTSGLRGDGDRLWLQTDDGDVLWSNFDIDAIAVTVDPESGKSWYQVALHRPHVENGDVLVDTIDGSTLGNWTKLQQWLANRRVTVVGPSSRMNVASRLQLYLEDQKPPAKDMLPWLGWHDGLGFATYEGIVTKEGVFDHEGAVPVVKRDAAPFRYGFKASEKEARGVLREVLTFHEEDVCAVFGAWWAACFLKAQVIRHTALFPFLALEAASESGKTTGFFSLMVQLNGNYYGQGEYSLPSLRDRIAAHRNGIVWIDDMSDVSATLDLVRQATAEGSKTKMAEGWTHQKSVRLVAPIVLSGESLGRLHDEKALIDRAVQLGASSPVHRKSVHDSSVPQWDDIVALRERYNGDLTSVAGTLVKMALQYEDRVEEGLRALRSGSGRVSDKWSVLRFGARLLSAMTQDKVWNGRVDAWIDRQVETGAENDLTLQVLPKLLVWEGFPNSPRSAQPGMSQSSIFLRDGDLWFSLPAAAHAWQRYVAGRSYNERTQSVRSLGDQKVSLGITRQKRWDGPSHSVRLTYWKLPREIADLVLERANATRRGDDYAG